MREDRRHRYSDASAVQDTAARPGKTGLAKTRPYGLPERVETVVPEILRLVRVVEQEYRPRRPAGGALPLGKNAMVLGAIGEAGAEMQKLICSFTAAVMVWVSVSRVCLTGLQRRYS